MDAGSATALPESAVTREPPVTVLTRLFLAVAAALIVVVVGPGAIPAQALADPDRLVAGEQLDPGERLVSARGGYVLIMQDDGNLVEFGPGKRMVWASKTDRPGSVAHMRIDGNLVIVAPGNIPIASTNTNGTPGASLELQSDGNIVVYAPGHIARWASAPPSRDLSQRIVALAGAQLVDVARNRETSYNCNFYSGQVAPGAAACGDDRRSEAWCADFARWVWGQAGVDTAGLDARAVSFTSYGEARGTWRTAGPKVGDAVVFNVRRDLNGRPATASHVGLVVAVNPDGTIDTIEGNAGPHTDQVWMGRRSVTSAGISGFASPMPA
jgi:hypothetical protein